MTTPSDKQTDNQSALQPPELLPCPFCGAAPNLKQVPSRTVSANYWWIGCEIKGDNLTHSLSGCGIGHSAWSESEVIAKWNTRARVDGVVGSPILAFESWLMRWVVDNGRKLTQDEYGIAYAAFIAAHPGEGPKAHVMDGEVADHALVQLLDAALLHPESAEGYIRQVIESLSDGGVATVDQKFTDAFRDTAIKAHIGFKHDGPWEECGWIECEDRRKMIESQAAPQDEQKTRCGECDEIIEGSHFCFICIEALKEKLRELQQGEKQ